jgi:hypothetical protein
MPSSAHMTEGAHTGGSTPRAAASPALNTRLANVPGGFLLVLVVLLVSLLIEGLIILGPGASGSGG